MIMANVKTLFVAAILCSAGIANAATFLGNTGVCKHLGDITSNVVELRDTGVAWEVFDAWISEQLALAKGDPRSYVKDDDDVKFIRDAFKRIYSDKLSVEVANTTTYNRCMTSKSSYKLTKFLPKKGAKK